MLFNSSSFLVFFPAVLALYFILPHRYRWLLLLVASYVYYMFAAPIFGFGLLFVTVLHYFLALGIVATPDKGTKRIYLWSGIVISIAALFTVKYFSPAATLFGFTALSAIGHVLMPIGISFYTLQAISYTMDVYSGVATAERNFGRFALFMAYFPKLILGPIERFASFSIRLFAEVKFDKDRVASGMQLMLWGYFKKLVVADRIAAIIYVVYIDPAHADTGLLWLAFILYPVQLYADFSGYIDIARGCSRMLGIELSINFNLPFFARSVTEFWTKWNMTLSSWFRDYVFYPLYLKLKRANPWHAKSSTSQHDIAFVISLTIMFLILGVWHELKWTYIVAALLQSVFIITETYLPILPKKSPLRRNTLISSLFTLKAFALFCFVTLFFRAESVSYAALHLQHLFVGSKVEGHAAIGLDPAFILLVITIIMMLAGEYLMTVKKAVDFVFRSAELRWGIYIVLIMLIIQAGTSHKSGGFQYLQF